MDDRSKQLAKIIVDKVNQTCPGNKYDEANGRYDQAKQRSNFESEQSIKADRSNRRTMSNRREAISPPIASHLY